MIIVNPSGRTQSDLIRYIRKLENFILPKLTDYGKELILFSNWFSLDDIHAKYVTPGSQFTLYDIYECSGAMTQLCEVVSADDYDFHYRVVGNEAVHCLPRHEWIHYLAK